MQITFEKASDLKHVYQLLYPCLGESLQYNDGTNTLYIGNVTDHLHIIHTKIVPALTEFIVKEKEPKFIQEILASIFFYDDESEQQQIIQMVQSLVKVDENQIHPSLKEGYRLEELIQHALIMFLTESIDFSFESFVKFRLKGYFSRLVEYIEVGIDEYKLEQDYQDFIENLRKYIASKQSTIHLVHVVHEEDQFFFFDEEFEPFTLNMLHLNEEFISLHGFEVDKELIAPLLLLCPNHVYMYSLQLDQSIVQTLVALFQERVQFFPHEQFVNQQH